MCDSEVLQLCIREPHGLLGMDACTKECSGRYTGVGFQPSISQVVTSFFPGIPLLRTASLSTESLPVSRPAARYLSTSDQQLFPSSARVALPYCQLEGENERREKVRERKKAILFAILRHMSQFKSL